MKCRTHADELRRARHVIERPEGWCQNAMRNASGGHCAAAAMLITDAGPRARSCLDRSLRGGWVSPVAYNDDPATTHADVLAWFDRAIALAEAELSRLDKTS